VDAHPWRIRRPRGRLRRRLVASQDPFAVQIGFAARHVAGVVAVPVELQRQQRRAGGLAREVLNVGVRAALEIGDVDRCRLGWAAATRAASRILRPEIQYMFARSSAAGSLPVTRKSSGITLAP